jgi:CRP-like cAMP-binding protein
VTDQKQRSAGSDACAEPPDHLAHLPSYVDVQTTDEIEAPGRGGPAPEVAFDPSQVIFARGDAGREIYLVVSGRVRLSVLTAEGRELSFAHAEAGAIFGEIAMLDGGPRSAAPPPSTR